MTPAPHFEPASGPLLDAALALVLRRAVGWLRVINSFAKGAV